VLAVVVDVLVMPNLVEVSGRKENSTTKENTTAATSTYEEDFKVIILLGGGASEAAPRSTDICRGGGGGGGALSSEEEEQCKRAIGRDRLVAKDLSFSNRDAGIRKMLLGMDGSTEVRR